MRYSYDADYFKKIDSKSKAYILGWICADGHVGKNTLAISIQEEDVAVLQFIQKELQTEVPIKIVPMFDKRSSVQNKNQARLRIYSTEIANSLRNLGLYGDKTKTLRLPDLPDTLMPSFLLGFFEGDGSIVECQGRYQLSFFTNDIVADQIQDYFQKVLGLEKQKIHKYKNCCQVRYTGIPKIQKIKNFLYTEAPHVLKRKYDKMVNVDYKKGTPHKKVYCYSLDGDLTVTYPTITSIKNSGVTSDRKIAYHLSMNDPTYVDGFMWSFSNTLNVNNDRIVTELVEF